MNTLPPLNLTPRELDVIAALNIAEGDHDLAHFALMVCTNSTMTKESMGDLALRARHKMYRWTRHLGEHEQFSLEKMLQDRNDQIHTLDSTVTQYASYIGGLGVLCIALTIAIINLLII